jgi:hypothetical protein
MTQTMSLQRQDLLEIESGTGELAVVEGFGEDSDLGVSMRGESWPHGDTGWAIPHGTVFSRSPRRLQAGRDGATVEATPARRSRNASISV